MNYLVMSRMSCIDRSLVLVCHVSNTPMCMPIYNEDSLENIYLYIYKKKKKKKNDSLDIVIFNGANVTITFFVVFQNIACKRLDNAL